MNMPALPDAAEVERRDRRAAAAGLVGVAITAVVYLLIAESVARPLSLFVVPALLTAVIGGWRPAALVGAVSLITAGIIGIPVLRGFKLVFDYPNRRVALQT